MNDKTAFPLSWPDGRPRTRACDRRTNRSFKQTFASSRDGCVAEIRRLGGDQIIISSNVPLKSDGMPFAMDWGRNRTKQGQQITDPAVAVYFTRKGKQLCFACDRWGHVEDNMHAIRLTVEALRGIARWGTGDMMEAAFRGYTALPERAGGIAWWDVLGVTVNASEEQITAAYREKAKIAHPDRGGTHEQMTALNEAYRAATQQKPTP